MLKSGDIVEFDRKKQFKYIKQLGGGGTGDTHLFKDETTDMLFAFKKYAPKNVDYVDEHYKRFVDEIKILFKISHPNIVRIYNYYLYPKQKLGYIQMEYVDGVTIDEYVPFLYDKQWRDIFREVISAFEYLEKNRILHRDIRPANILIDNNENIKIIDFGFGKELKTKEQDGRSVLLNWPVTELPEETLSEGFYNHQTEIYFVGKLFEHLLGDEIEEFEFYHVIEKMTKVKIKQRYKSFDEVSKAISMGILSIINFTEQEKEIYLKFADQLSSHIISYKNRYSPIDDLHATINSLEALIRDSSLEKYIQANDRLINCFINSGYRYYASTDIEVDCVRKFYELLKGLSLQKQKIVLDNIYTRLAKIKIDIDDELPF
ncbi:MAG: protein kinase family protein [Firmicutes bacterium]|nr:protein kinase family protein [Bacillota bacterium]